jgi:hypothetical protein
LYLGDLSFRSEVGSHGRDFMILVALLSPAIYNDNFKKECTITVTVALESPLAVVGKYKLNICKQSVGES